MKTQEDSHTKARRHEEGGGISHEGTRAQRNEFPRECALVQDSRASVLECGSPLPLWEKAWPRLTPIPSLTRLRHPDFLRENPTICGMGVSPKVTQASSLCPPFPKHYFPPITAHPPLYARPIFVLRNRRHAPHRLEACVTFHGLTPVPHRIRRSETSEGGERAFCGLAFPLCAEVASTLASPIPGESGSGLPQSKTLSRRSLLPRKIPPCAKQTLRL